MHDRAYARKVDPDNSFDTAPPIAPEAPPSNAIAELQTIPQWVAWRYEHVGEGKKLTKVPVNPATGGNASTSEPTTWGAYEAAAKRAESVDGIGFVLSDDDNITGYDFDDCRNPENGHIRPWAREILAYGETYAEVSPSGKGIRLFARGKIPEAIVNAAARVEVYGRGRYLTVTGRHIEGTPAKIGFAPRTKAACQQRNKLHSEMSAAIQRAAKPAADPNGGAPRSSTLNDLLRSHRPSDSFWGDVNSAALQSLDALGAGTVRFQGRTPRRPYRRLSCFIEGSGPTT